MNDAHLHLVLNHFPIIIPFLALIIIVCGYIFKSSPVIRMAYVFMILSAFFTIATVITGEGAEEIAEHVSGIDKDFIEAHEEHAETFAKFSYALGLLSLVGLWASLKAKSYHKFVSGAVILFALVTLYFAKLTGTSGGEIRHTEIRSGSSLPEASFDDEHDEEKEHKHHEDEHENH